MQSGVQAAARHQLVVRAALDDATIIEHQDSDRRPVPSRSGARPQSPSAAA